MKRRLSWLLLLVLLPVHVMRADVAWDDGCDAAAVEAITAGSDRSDYAQGCEAYLSCEAESNRRDVKCELQAMQVMAATCAAGDEACQQLTLLLAAAMVAYEPPFGQSSYSWDPPQTLIDGVPQGLAAFRAGDYAGALAAFQSTPQPEVFSNTSLPLALAISYEMLEEPEAALAEFDVVFSVEFAYPLAWVARAGLYGKLGRLDEASFDAEALALYTADRPVLQPLTAALRDRYPLDETRFSDWLMYPVMSIGAGSGGGYSSDLTLEPARPARIGVFDELGVMVAMGLTNWSVDEGPNARGLVILRQTTEGDFRYDYPEYGENSGSLWLRRTADGFLEGSEGISYFEGGVRWDFVLRPVGVDDPRPTDHERRFCPGSVISQLSIGQWVQSATYRDLGMPVQPAQVVDGPYCLSGRTHWKVVSGEKTLLIAENRGTQYQLVPAEALG